MDTFIIEGGAPLSGSITVEGNKNAALPLRGAGTAAAPAPLCRVDGVGAPSRRRRC